MLSIKLLDDYIIKEGDIKPFKIQLLRDMQPSPILDGCTATVIIADKNTILYEEPLTIVDAKQGIVEFTFNSNIGAGTFDCEFIVTNDDDIHLTFPDNGYTQLKITASLSKRPEGSVTKSEYAKLNERIDGVIELIASGGVEGGGIDLDNYVTDDELTQGLDTKQDKLVSGTNIKTINGTSILGSGNITIEGGTGGNVDLSGYATTTQVNAMQITINELLARIEELENNIFVTVQPEGTTPTLTSISATYNGGNVTTGTNINSLTGITVEGTYSDGTVKTVTGYTLSGTIGEGSNTITVTYEGKTTTFTVIGVASGGTEPEPEPTQYTLTINATPSDAIIKINNVAQKTITVTEGTSVTWEVSKEGYVTQSGTKIVNATETMAITLVEEETGGGDSGGESGDTVTIATLDDFTNMNTLLRFTGVEEAKSAYHCTDFIDISNYSSVTCDVMPKTVSNSPVCWYDADKNYISGVRLDTDTENPTITDYNLQATLTYAVPENAVYAKFGAYAKVTGDGTFNTNYYATITGVLK